MGWNRMRVTATARVGGAAGNEIEPGGRRPPVTLRRVIPALCVARSINHSRGEGAAYGGRLWLPKRTHGLSIASVGRGPRDRR